MARGVLDNLTLDKPDNMTAGRVSLRGNRARLARITGPARGLAPACGEDGAAPPGLRWSAGYRQLKRRFDPRT